jgi:signal transduction histidine kinase
MFNHNFLNLRQTGVNEMNSDKNQEHYYRQIFKLGQIITYETNLEKLFPVIMEQINQIMQTQKCSIFLHDVDSDELYCQVSTDLKKNEIRISASHGLAGWVFQNKTAQILNDPYNDPRFLQKVDKATGFKTRNLICIPLINRKNICIGTLQVLNKKEALFSDRDKDLLTAASHYVVISLENAKLYKDLKVLDKARERVVDHISHELKTPVSLILSVLTQLGRRLADKSSMKGVDKIIQRGLRNVQRLIDLQEKADDILTQDVENISQEYQQLIHFIETTIFLLDNVQDQSNRFSELIGIILERLEDMISHKEFHEEKLHIKTFMEMICDDARSSMGNRKISFVTDFDDTLSIIMDKAVLTKACGGLLKNAIENTPDHGTIFIKAESVNNNIEIQFQDYGVGITKENQGLIFGGFFHTQDTMVYSSKTPYEFNAGGSGADLLRIKTLAERHGFGIDFKSIRCRFLPLDIDICPGSIEKCKNITSLEECRSSGGSLFTLQFQSHPMVIDQ